MGDPSDENTTLGPLYAKDGVDHLKEQVDKSVNMGAKAYSEFKCDIPVECKDGFFFKPMILEDVPEDSPAYKEELFGPVFTLFKFSDEKDAIRIANDNIYGLGSSVFSKDIDKAKKLAL